MARLNKETGELVMKQEMQLSSAIGNTGAEIVIHSNGRWVYVSSRGVGMVIFFQLEEGNTLRKVSKNYKSLFKFKIHPGTRVPHCWHLAKAHGTPLCRTCYCGG